MDLTTLIAFTAALSFLICSSKAFEALRIWISGFGRWPHQLISCGYCLGHWICLVVLLFQPPTSFVEFLATWLVVSWLAGLAWAVSVWLFNSAGL